MCKAFELIFSYVKLRRAAGVDDGQNKTFNRVKLMK